MKRILLAAIVVLALALSAVGGTFAGFSDSEASLDNVFEVADLDLKVNGQDDEPWGSGVGLVFSVTNGQVCSSYEETVSLFNAGDVTGDVYLLIKDLVDPDNLAPSMHVDIYYDDGSPVASGWMSALAYSYIPLDDLAFDHTGVVRIVLHPTGGGPGDTLQWDMEFALIQQDGGGFSDTELSQNNLLQLAHCQTGTIGFWKNWDSHNTYSQSEIEGWLTGIDVTSAWLGPTTTAGMVNLINVGTGGTMEQRFLAHYLAQRLDQASGRQSPSTTHNVAAYDPTNYLGLPSWPWATGGEIVSAIEAKYGTSPTYSQFEIMKDVCDALNNLWI